MERQVFFAGSKDELKNLIKNSLEEVIKESQIVKTGQESRLVAIKKAAEKYDTTTRFIYKLHSEGKINLKKLNKRTYVDILELEKCMTTKTRE